MSKGAGSTVLVFCDPSRGVCGLFRTERFEEEESRHTLAAVEPGGLTNWMVRSKGGEFTAAEGRWTFEGDAWRVEDPTHLGVAGQLGLFAFDERRIRLTLESSGASALEAPWIRAARREDDAAARTRLDPDQRLRRLFSAPSRSWFNRLMRGSGARSVEEIRVAGLLETPEGQTTVDGLGWIETVQGADVEPLIDESWTLVLGGGDGSGLFGQSVARGRDLRVRGAVRREGGLAAVKGWRLEGEIPPAGKSAPVSFRAETGVIPFEWTGEAATVVSEAVQGRGRYATRRLVRFSKNGAHAGLGSFLAREYP